MNCQVAEKQVLLAHAGELSAWSSWRVERHVARCTACRHYVASLQQLSQLQRLPEADLTLRELILARILATARAELAEGASAHGAAWKAVWAMAASVLLVLGSALSPWAQRSAVWDRLVRHAPAMAWNDNTDQQLVRIDERVFMAEAVNGTDKPAPADNADENSIANELLDLES